MDDKKNVFIGALIALLLISAVWGQVESRKRKNLTRQNEELQTQLRSGKEAAAACGEYSAEAARQKEARQQTAVQLENARKKIEDLQGKLSKLMEQEKALAALQEEKDKASAAAEAEKKDILAQSEAKLNGLQGQLVQQQTVLEQQEQKLAEAANVLEKERQQTSGCQAKLADQQKMQAELDELDAAGKQIEEERNKILAETDTLRAQVIGLEKIVEERSANLEQSSKELENCKINNNVLLNQIAQQVKPDPKKITLPAAKSKTEQQMPALQPPTTQQPAQKK